jgi:hypothetical protein
VWSKDGRELFYRRGQALVAVKVDTIRGLRTEPPRVLFDASSFVGAGGDLSFDVAPDGHRFLMTKTVDAAASRQLVLVHNWFEELKRGVSSRNCYCRWDVCMAECRSRVLAKFSEISRGQTRSLKTFRA